MTWVDWAIVFALAASVIGGLTQGLFRSACSLGGLILGLVLGAWNYWRAANILRPLVRVDELANALGFLLIAMLVMVIAHIVGVVLSKTVRQIGLGCLDRLAGGVFGFFQGALLITVVILAVVAFYPKSTWLADARLPKYFVGACHLTIRMTPQELSDKVRAGLLMMEQRAPEWMHPPTS